MLIIPPPKGYKWIVNPDEINIPDWPDNYGRWRLLLWGEDKALGDLFYNESAQPNAWFPVNVTKLILPGRIYITQRPLPTAADVSTQSDCTLNQVNDSLKTLLVTLLEIGTSLKRIAFDAACLRKQLTPYKDPL